MKTARYITKKLQSEARTVNLTQYAEEIPKPAKRSTSCQPKMLPILSVSEPSKLNKVNTSKTDRLITSFLPKRTVVEGQERFDNKKKSTINYKRLVKTSNQTKGFRIKFQIKL